MNYTKRLIEVDLPIKRISAHSRREKSIRHGHICTLHIWWARRPLAACRAVICAALWPDPADKLCPQDFRDRACDAITEFAKAAVSDKKLSKMCSEESWGTWNAISKLQGTSATAKATGEGLDPKKPEHWNVLRNALLDFIADFARWEASTEKHYLDTSRKLTQAAHEALGGAPGTRPLVVDPFAGGGAIPLEALRVGADAFASDLNPVAVLLNKVVLEYIPKYGKRLADEVRKWGQWIKEQAEKELAEFYPKDPDGATPIAYLWARTIKCEGPGCGAEVPLIKQLWIKKSGRDKYAFVLRADRKAKKVAVQIAQDPSTDSVGSGTVSQASVTCPICGFTTPASSTRKQAVQGKMGLSLIGVVLSRAETTDRKFRSPNSKDLRSIREASKKLMDIERQSEWIAGLRTEIPLTELRRISVPLYGMTTFRDLFLNRQLVAFAAYESLIKEAARLCSRETNDVYFTAAVETVLSLSVSNVLHYNMNLSTYLLNHMISAYIQGTSLAMRWDFAEANPTMEKLVGGFDYSLLQVDRLLKNALECFDNPGTAQALDATNLSLPDCAASLVVTDPPYYDSIPYSHLADVFYLWLKGLLRHHVPDMLETALAPKTAEIVEDRAHSRSPTKKGADHFESAMASALGEARRILSPEQLAVVIFAHKSTRGWEAMLKGLMAAGWQVTASWPIDTERPARMNAYQNASLLSSVHICCRPRERDSVGEWSHVLQDLPKRVHEWMPRLSREGIVGADAIFACLGPALEIFSRYSSVEKPNGEKVTLKDYLEHVWAAVAKEALNMIFEGAETTGFEEDARLTAMWLWTLSAGANGNGKKTAAETVGEEVEVYTTSTGYTLEFDTARKIAQGLGAHMEDLAGVVEVKGDKARLLPVGERTRYLFGKDQSEAPRRGRKKKVSSQMTFDFARELAKAEEEEGGWGVKGVSRAGSTTLDRVHQSMILFAAGRNEALKRFVVEEGIGREERFWRLAQALSALYPAHTDEKRWVDGVLARKKGLGF